MELFGFLGVSQAAGEMGMTGCSESGVRLRPILMTTAAMVFGVVLLVVAAGAG